MPMARPVTQLGCIVDNCDWTYTEPDPVQHLDGRGRTIEDMVTRAMHAHAGTVEAAVREHLENHDIADWVRTVSRLRGMEERAEIVERAPIPPLHPMTARYIIEGNPSAGVAVQED